MQELLLLAILMSEMKMVAELEELVDKTGTTIGTYFSVVHFIRLPSLMSCSDHWSTRKNIRDPRRVFRLSERPVYLREASLSRINKIL